MRNIGNGARCGVLLLMVSLGACSSAAPGRRDVAPAAPPAAAAPAPAGGTLPAAGRQPLTTEPGDIWAEGLDDHRAGNSATRMRR